MTSKSEKLLAKLDHKQRKVILEVLKRLVAGDHAGLDIKPIKGHKYFYRARVGRYRIIYRNQGETFEFIGLSKRDDQTYRDF